MKKWIAGLLLLLLVFSMVGCGGGGGGGNFWNNAVIVTNYSGLTLDIYLGSVYQFTLGPWGAVGTIYDVVPGTYYMEASAGWLYDSAWVDVFANTNTYWDIY